MFSWRDIQPQTNGPFDFARPTRWWAPLPRHRIEVLPVMLYAPTWARAFPRDGASPPLTKPYQAFLRASIRRYGRNGSFWRENPDVPRQVHPLLAGVERAALRGLLGRAGPQPLLATRAATPGC